MRTSIVVLSLLICTAALAQNPSSKGGRPAGAQQPTGQQAAGQSTQQTAPTPGDPADLDNIIDLVKANTSESLVLKMIQRQNKVYDLGPADMLKLQKAGVSERVIGALLDPTSISTDGAVPSGAAPSTPNPSGSGPGAAASPNMAAPGGGPGNGAAPGQPSAPSANTPQSAPAANGAHAQQANTGQQGAATQPQKKGGMFSGFLNSIEQSAGQTVGNSANQQVQTGQSKVNSSVNGALGTPIQPGANGVAPAGTAKTAAATTPTPTAAAQTAQQTAQAQAQAQAQAAEAAKVAAMQQQLQQVQQQQTAQTSAQTTAQQKAAERQQKMQKLAACQKQAIAANPQGGTPLSQALTACNQAP